MMKRWYSILAIYSCALVQVAALGQEQALLPKLWMESMAIEIGKIAVDQDKIEGVIRYMNEGNGVLEISNITGSCDCF